MPRPAHLFLHIGLPKTGTTAWQNWADTHRMSLRTRGLDYPEAMTVTNSPNHSIIHKDMMQGHVPQLLALLDGGRCDKMLLSDEGLSNTMYLCPETGFAAFRDATRGIEVTCILCVRAAEEWLTSMYGQSLFNRSNPRLGNGTAEPIEVFAQRPRIQALLDHDRLAADAVARFGAAGCRIIDYGDTAFPAFCAAMGLDTSGLPPPERANVSVTKAAKSIMRQVNAMRVEEDLRNGMLWLLQQAERSSLNRLRGAGRPDVALSAALSSVVAALRPENEEERDLTGQLRTALAAWAKSFTAREP